MSREVGQGVEADHARPRPSVVALLPTEALKPLEMSIPGNYRNITSTTERELFSSSSNTPKPLGSPLGLKSR